MKAQELFSSQFLGGLSNKSDFRIKIRVGNFIISLSKYPDTWVWILGYWYYPMFGYMDSWIFQLFRYPDTWIQGYLDIKRDFRDSFGLYCQSCELCNSILSTLLLYLYYSIASERELNTGNFNNFNSEIRFITVVILLLSLKYPS